MFKLCSKCGTRWKTRESFLRDRSLKLEGYQKTGQKYGNGFLLFTHNCNNCGTTIAIPARSFKIKGEKQKMGVAI
jgi:hypothetical protein